MITDQQTNVIYFSTLLKESHPEFWNNLEIILKRHSVSFKWIKNTRDIWCRDYMPIQLEDDKYVQFKFFPDYYLNYDNIGLLTLQYEMNYNHTGSEKLVDLIVDGGNIVKSNDKVIVTEKVFKENNKRGKKSVIGLLKEALEVKEVIIIPKQPEDLSGHADGMVRFYNDNTILVNELSESPSWMDRLNRSIKLSGLKDIPFPYQYSERRNKVGEYTAHGCYINFAQIGKLIIFPQFGDEFSDTDVRALQKIQELYPAPEYIIEPINADSIAWYGGVLNCCTWNILKTVIKDAINKLVPVYWSHDNYLLVLEDDYIKRPVNDTVCVKLCLNSSEYYGPWSLEKHLKFGFWENEVSSQKEIIELRKTISSKFDEIEISDIYLKLQNPSSDVISELVSIPERLTKESITHQDS
jgi:agmatine deiminase